MPCMARLHDRLYINFEFVNEASNDILLGYCSRPCPGVKRSRYLSAKPFQRSMHDIFIKIASRPSGSPLFKNPVPASHVTSALLTV